VYKLSIKYERPKVT